MRSIYRLEFNADDIGCFPQAQILPSEGWQYWGDTSIINIPLEGVIPFRPQFPRLGLEKSANLTDVMSTVILSDLLVSEKLYKTFTIHLVDAHQCFGEILETNSGKYTYMFLFLNFPRDEDVFDWPKCVFFDLNDPEKKTFSVSDAQAYRQACNGKVIKHQRMVLRVGQPVFDLFMCRHFKTGGKSFYVTAQMKEAIETAGITGIRFEEIPCLEQEDL